MPQIKIKGIQVEHVKEISKDMVDELQAIIDCPREYFVIECINNPFIMDGSFVQGSPFVEVAWFDRGQEVQDTVAKVITKYVHQMSYTNVDVVFTVFEKSKYYENGEHF